MLVFVRSKLSNWNSLGTSWFLWCSWFGISFQARSLVATDGNPVKRSIYVGTKTYWTINWNIYLQKVNPALIKLILNIVPWSIVRVHDLIIKLIKTIFWNRDYDIFTSEFVGHDSTQCPECVDRVIRRFYCLSNYDSYIFSKL